MLLLSSSLPSSLIFSRIKSSIEVWQNIILNYLGSLLISLIKIRSDLLYYVLSCIPQLAMVTSLSRSDLTLETHSLDSLPVSVLEASSVHVTPRTSGQTSRWRQTAQNSSGLQRRHQHDALSVYLVQHGSGSHSPPEKITLENSG